MNSYSKSRKTAKDRSAWRQLNIAKDQLMGRRPDDSRMIQRFHDQVLQRMSPERRARKLSVMKALARASIRIKNKENEGPLNNNMALPFNIKHSTPLKHHQITDLDRIEPESELEEREVRKIIVCLEEKEEEERRAIETEPQLVISRIYDLEPEDDSSGPSFPRAAEENERSEEFEIEVRSPEIEEVDEKTKSEKEERHWRSLEVLDETAEYEFCRSLEESKLFVSTSSLLEEIEADLPSPYSLARPLNHTLHTLTSYRTITRLARMDGNSTCPESLEKRQNMNISIPLSKRKSLEMEVMVQKVLAKQAEKALILSKSQKFLGVEHVESEKTFLLANLRFNAASQELEKLKVLGETPEKENFGQVTVTEICFTVDSIEDGLDKFLCTATENENVQSSSIVSDIIDGKLYFNQPFKFQNLGKDFVIFIELFKLHYKEAKKAMLTTSLLQKLRKMTSVNLNKSLTDSYHGSSGFTCIACAELRLHHITSRENDKCVLRFIEAPQFPVTESSVHLFVKTDVNLELKEKGFLNVFKQTWHRRWYSLSNCFLECWQYPEDEDFDKPPIESIFLPSSLTEAKAVQSDVCIRPHSFVVVAGQPAEETLFAADSHKDMIKWIDHLSLIIEHVTLWKPTE